MAKSVDRLFKSVIRVAGPSAEKNAHIFHRADILRTHDLFNGRGIPKRLRKRSRRSTRVPAMSMFPPRGMAVDKSPAMPPRGGVVSPEDIENVVAHIRQNLCKCEYKK